MQELQDQQVMMTYAAMVIEQLSRIYNFIKSGKSKRELRAYLGPVITQFLAWQRLMEVNQWLAQLQAEGPE